MLRACVAALSSVAGGVSLTGRPPGTPGKALTNLWAVLASTKNQSPLLRVMNQHIFYCLSVHRFTEAMQGAAARVSPACVCPAAGQ